MAPRVDKLFSLLLSRAFSGQLTAKWREGHMNELLAEMEPQARALNLPAALEDSHERGQIHAHPLRRPAGRHQAAHPPCPDKAWLSVNAELIRLYWEISALIDTRQRQEGWGAGVIPRLARDLHNELPEEKGFSERNIKRMLAFYREYPDLAFVPQAVAQIRADEEVPQSAALFTPELVLAVLMDLYCSVVDDRLRHGDGKPTIGLILCQQHNRVLAEYALRGMDKPIGVSSFELTRALPAELQTSLPSIEEIERVLSESAADDTEDTHR